MAASMNNFLIRRLQEISSMEEGDDSDASTNSAFDAVLFWSVNAIWMTALASVIIWIWKCGGAQCLTESIRRDSDAAYRRRLAQRRRVEREKRQVSPDKRSKMLMEYFRSNKVHMVVTELDIVANQSDEPEPAPAQCETDSYSPVASTSLNPAVDIEAGRNPESNDGSETENATTADLNCIDLESSIGSDEEPPRALEIDAGVALDDSSRSSTGRKSALLSFSRDNSIASAVDESESFPPAIASLDASLKSGLMDDLDGSIRSIDQGFLTLGNKLQVPNCCAVCLAAYEVGEDVVWSNNCLHAFHEECVTSWLTKMQEGNPCPCCRSAFVEMDPEEQPARKRVDDRMQYQPRALNFDVIRL